MNEAVAKQGAGDSVLLPSSDFITANATLNWIAFQRAEDADLTGRNSLWREFGFEPVLPPMVGGWDYVLAEAANLLEPEHHALMRHWQTAFGREPKNLQAARDTATRYREMRGWSAVELHLYSTGRRVISAQRLGKLRQAQNDLVDALAAERLTTWATTTAGSSPNCEPNFIGIASAVPWQFFLTHNVSVHATGAIAVNAEPVYLHAKFRAAEVLALWPLMTDPVPTSDNRTLPTLPSDPADFWMFSHVTEPGKWKLESAIAQCRSDTGSTYRAAKAAWQKLPEGLRGKRGAHK